MSDSLQRIERTIIALRAGLPLPKELAQWLDKGLVARTKGISLDQSLGLSKAGQRLPETKTRYKERDKLLSEAFGLISGNVFYQRIEEFSKQINQFESINWPRDKHHPAPPEHYPPFKKKLFEVFSIGLRVPSSKSQLCLLLSNSGIHRSKSDVKSDNGKKQTYERSQTKES